MQSKCPIEAGLLRANALRANEELVPQTRIFWDGYAKALQDLKDGTLAALAERDAQRLQDVQTGAQGAGTGLTIGAEVLAAGLVTQARPTEGVEISADAVANGNVDAAQQLKNDELAPVVNLHEKHASDGMKMGNCSDHLSSAPLDSSAPTVAQEGGAA